MLDFADAEQTAAAARKPADLPMDDGDVTPTSSPFSPRALQLCVNIVPFCGLPAAVPLAAADGFANTCAKAAAPASAPASAVAAFSIAAAPVALT